MPGLVTGAQINLSPDEFIQLIKAVRSGDTLPGNAASGPSHAVDWMPASRIADSANITQQLNVTAAGEARITNESGKATYAAVVTGFTPVATPTDFWQITGSATKTVRVQRLEVYGVATAANAVLTHLVKRTTTSTGGTPTAATLTKHDTNDPTATAVVNTFAANPSPLGTSAGDIRAALLALSVAGGSQTIQPGFVADMAYSGGRAAVLRGVAESLNLNWGGAAVPAGTLLTIVCEFTEE